MKPLQIKHTKYGEILQGKSMDFGEWDISVGAEKSFFIKNPNKYAKADLSGLKNRDSRVSINLPDYIMPEETAEATFTIEAQVFESEEDEERYFTNVLDQLIGTVKWRVP